jgi:hypothetical protein
MVFAGQPSYHGGHDLAFYLPALGRFLESAGPPLVWPVAPDAAVSGGHLDGLGLDLPRDQVRADEFPAVLSDGHALSVRRRLADGLDALARRTLARSHPMAQRGRRWHADAGRRHGRHRVRRSVGRVRPGGRVHRDRAADDRGTQPAVGRAPAAPGSAGHPARPGRGSDADTGRGLSGLARRTHGDRDRLCDLVARQRVEPPLAPARTGRHRFRQRNALRRRGADGDVCLARRSADMAAATGRPGSVVLPRDLRFADRFQRLHAAAGARTGRARVELYLCQPGDRDAAGRGVCRRDRDRIRMGLRRRGAGRRAAAVVAPCRRWRGHFSRGE